MPTLELIGVGFSSAAARGGIADGIAALREAGLAERLTAVSGDFRDGGDLALEQPTGGRGPSRLLKEEALTELLEATKQATARAHARGGRPLFVGGDCPVLLGPLAALRDRHGRAALLMVDGHEDAWPPQSSPTGEASDSEIALALGLVRSLPPALASAVPLVSPDAIAMLGPRDAEELVRAGIRSLAGTVGLLLDDAAIRRAGLTPALEQALAVVRQAAPAYWLHVDLDVLASSDFAAADYQQRGGLQWDDVRRVIVAALADRRCAGASVVIYNPDLDPGRTIAAEVVAQLAAAVAAARNGDS